MLKALFNEALQRAKFSVLRLSLRPQVFFEGSEQRRMRYGVESISVSCLHDSALFHVDDFAEYGLGAVLRGILLRSRGIFVRSALVPPAFVRSALLRTSALVAVCGHIQRVHQYLRSVHRPPRSVHGGHPLAAQAPRAQLSANILPAAVSSSGVRAATLCACADHEVQADGMGAGRPSCEV